MAKLSNNAVSRDSRCSPLEDWIKSLCVDVEAVWYRIAEVTLREGIRVIFHKKIMECSDHRGLYFTGEVVGVTRHLGGFPFNGPSLQDMPRGLSSG